MRETGPRARSIRPARTGLLRSAGFASLIPRGKQMRNWLEMNPSTLVLARGELATLRLRGRACRISCVTGRLWVTASGRREDSVLAPGGAVTFTGRGRIVVEALRTATVRLEIHTAPGAFRLLCPRGSRPQRGQPREGLLDSRLSSLNGGISPFTSQATPNAASMIASNTNAMEEFSK